MGKGGLKNLSDRIKKFFSKRKEKKGGGSEKGGAHAPGSTTKIAGKHGDLGEVNGQKVVSETPTHDGHKIKTLEDGTCVICSKCQNMRDHVRQNYQSDLKKNPKLEADLAALEKKMGKKPVDPNVSAQYDQLLKEIQDGRKARPGKLKNDYAAEIDPVTKKKLDDIEAKLKDHPANQKAQRQLEAIEKDLQIKRYETASGKKWTPEMEVNYKKYVEKKRKKGETPRDRQGWDTAKNQWYKSNVHSKPYEAAVHKHLQSMGAIPQVSMKIRVKGKGQIPIKPDNLVPVRTVYRKGKPVGVEFKIYDAKHSTRHQITSGNYFSTLTKEQKAAFPHIIGGGAPIQAIVSPATLKKLGLSPGQIVFIKREITIVPNLHVPSAPGGGAGIGPEINLK